ncbi:MAG: rRNA pseudouridine synthase [Clostridia bacterium]|nr:rRNA pseudouridine synthase [Clostridia bacterium]
MTDRLDKILSDCGSSRSEAKVYIKTGRVTVNGQTVTRPETKADPQADEIKLDGRSIGEKLVYIMINKPSGVLSATEDEKQKTVVELLPEEYKKRGVFPVGRLDKDTTGLLILTNDGEFAHAVTSPAKHVFKTYEALVDGDLDEKDVEAFRQGIHLRDGTKCLPAELLVDITNTKRAQATIMEGKYHQVKRMFASRGKPVVALKRLSIGGLRLDSGLDEGAFRLLTPEEKVSVFSSKNYK